MWHAVMWHLSFHKVLSSGTIPKQRCCGLDEPQNSLAVARTQWQDINGLKHKAHATTTVLAGHLCSTKTCWESVLCHSNQPHSAQPVPLHPAATPFTLAQGCPPCRHVHHGESPVADVCAPQPKHAGGSHINPQLCKSHTPRRTRVRDLDFFLSLHHNRRGSVRLGRARVCCAEEKPLGEYLLLPTLTIRKPRLFLLDPVVIYSGTKFK